MKTPNGTRRVVVTGLGTINPLAHNPHETWKKIVAGESGISRITSFDASEHKTQIGGEVKDFDAEAIFGRRDARRMDRAAHLGLAAAMQAVEEAKIDRMSADEKRNIGVVFGNCIGGFQTAVDNADILFNQGPSRINPFFIPMMLSDSISSRISMTFGLRGSNITVATACASGTNAVGEAARMVAAGVSDIMVTGGGETSLVKLPMAGFDVMGAMSTYNDEPTTASRPFDATRNGFVPSDGATVLVLEEMEHAKARGVHIYGEIIGYGSTADAYHLTAPREDGDGAVESMHIALEEAGIELKEVGYINAHGTSTPLNDRMETVAIKRVFGEHAYDLAVSSTKSMHGHMLGGAGSIEIMLCLLALENQVLPPTINYENPDPELDLDYVPNYARPAQFNVAMSNSFGFGGHNATLIARRYQG